MTLPSFTVPTFSANPILAWPRSVKRLVVVAMDVILSLIAMWLAFTLRLDTLHWPEGDQWWVYGLAPLVSVPIFVRFGLYRAIFRYTGLAALMTIAQAVTVYGLILLCTLWWLQHMQFQVIPRSMGVLQPLIFLFLVIASRTMARAWLADISKQKGHQVARLLIYGAGIAGVQIAAALNNDKSQYKLLGFIDDDHNKVGRSINGIKIYAQEQISALILKQGITDILLALPSATRDRRNKIIRALDCVPVHVRTIPGFSDLTSGRVSTQDIRELEIEDLLGRETVPPNPQLLARNLTGKVVLVTGAGGSIGGELCRQIIGERPQRLLLLDHNEFGLYSIHRELESILLQSKQQIELTPLLASVSNYARLTEICEHHRPSTIYHAAAYKHVPMVEANAAEGILNNVFGTLNIARAAVENKADHFVLISTDKAVRPTNVMGASKRVAELILQALASSPSMCLDLEDSLAPQAEVSTCFSMVRFGNVLGSSGSVVPLFREQLAAGGPVTVTHAEVTRYFMTLSEAAQLVLQAGAMAKGGDVFVLDMGEPVKILDLARRMVTLSGLTVRDDAHPDGDIEIAISGLRPGEKLYEELLIGGNPQPTEHPRIMRARETHLPWIQLSESLSLLKSSAIQGKSTDLYPVLQQLVHGFEHAELK